jgi:hypothetical protein
LCDQAERTFREKCTGVRWELGTAHRFALWPLIYMGDLVEAANRLPGLLREARERDDLYGETNLCLVVRTFLRLAADEPALARRELREVMDRWSQAGFHVQHMNRLFDDTQIDLYEGAGEQAYQRITEGWPLVQRSQLLRVQQVRIFLGHLRARAALATGDAARLGEVDRDVRALEREQVKWARALARLLAAGVAARRGSIPEAIALLREGAELCDTADMELYAAAARYQMGVLIGGPAGSALTTEAAAWMRGQRVARPERMAAMLVPGGG